jgi:isoquinoline 1-oxidoreductase alpha subunit
MLTLNVNGQTHELEADVDMPLLWALRDLLGLTGTKYGCGIAQCGVCTVLVDGMPIRSCVTPLSALAKKKIVTNDVGVLRDVDVLADVQRGPSPQVSGG